MAPLTDREQTLLLSLFELEVENAELIEAKWENTKPEDHDDGDNSLAYEQAFSAGRRLGAQAALTMFRKVIDQ